MKYKFWSKVRSKKHREISFYFLQIDLLFFDIFFSLSFSSLAFSSCLLCNSFRSSASSSSGVLGSISRANNQPLNFCFNPWRYETKEIKCRSSLYFLTSFTWKRPLACQIWPVGESMDFLNCELLPKLSFYNRKQI